MNPKFQAMNEANEELKSGYQDFLEKVQNSARIGQVDWKRTIELVEAAKGQRSLRQFAEELEISAATLSRILNGGTNTIRPEYLARIALHAEPGSDVTLDALMKAQGLGRVESNVHNGRVLEDMCSKIVAYELLEKGCSVRLLPEKQVHNRFRPDFSITTDVVQGEWLFEIKAFPEVAKAALERLLRSALNSIMVYYYTGGKAGRYTLVLTTRTVFELAKIIAEEYGPIPNEISIMYLSLVEEKIVEEFVLPLNEGRQVQSLFINK